jgi:hypothetical protein
MINADLLQPFWVMNVTWTAPAGYPLYKSDVLVGGSTVTVQWEIRARTKTDAEAAAAAFFGGRPEYANSVISPAVLGRATGYFPINLPSGDLDAGGGKTWVNIWANDWKSMPDLAEGSFVPTSGGSQLVSTCAAYPYFNSIAQFYPDNAGTTHHNKSYAILPGEPGYLPNKPDGSPGAFWPPCQTLNMPSETMSLVSLGGGDKALQIRQFSRVIAGKLTALGANFKPRNPAAGAPYKFDPGLRIQFWVRATEVMVDGVDVSATRDFTTGTDNRLHSLVLMIDSGNWPGNGEPDIIEGSSNRRMKGNYHPASPTNQTFPINTASPITYYDWHLITVEWRTTSLQIWYDAERVLNTTDRVPQGALSVHIQDEMDWRQAPADASAKLQYRWFSMWKLV